MPQTNVKNSLNPFQSDWRLGLLEHIQHVLR